MEDLLNWRTLSLCGNSSIPSTTTVQTYWLFGRLTSKYFSLVIGSAFYVLLSNHRAFPGCEHSFEREVLKCWLTRGMWGMRGCFICRGMNFSDVQEIDWKCKQSFCVILHLALAAWVRDVRIKRFLLQFFLCAQNHSVVNFHWHRNCNFGCVLQI